MYSTPMLLYMIDFFVPDDIYAVMHYMLYETDNFDAPDDLNYLYYGNTFPTGLFSTLVFGSAFPDPGDTQHRSSSNSTSSMWHNHAVLTEESCCCCCVCCNGVVAAGAFVWWWVAVPRGSVCGGGARLARGGVGVAIVPTFYSRCCLAIHQEVDQGALGRTGDRCLGGVGG